MTLEEATRRCINNAEYERTHGNLQGCLSFSLLAEWPKELKDLRERTKWIPVTERLPEERLAVLVWCPQRRNIYCAYYDTHNVNKVVYSEWFIFGAFNTLVNEDVVAWMPLPEPYKEVCE